MINTEQAFDMLPTVVELYEKLDIDGYRKQLIKENKGKKNINSEILGIDFFKYVLKNSRKIKKEMFEVVAIFTEKTIEEVKKQSPVETINTFREIFEDEDVIELFKSAIV